RHAKAGFEQRRRCHGPGVGERRGLVQCARKSVSSSTGWAGDIRLIENVHLALTDPEEAGHAVVNLAINAGIVLVVVVSAKQQQLIIVRTAGTGRIRKVRQYFPSERRDVGCRNRSVRRIELAREGIHNRNGKVPGAVTGGWNSVEVQNLPKLAKSFVVAEEEGQILNDRAADRSAELIALQQRLLE